MTETRPHLVHASCVAVDGVGILLRGASGTGKSDLALRMIDGGGLLVSDDQTEIVRHDEGLLARPPSALAGLLEVRGLGIVRLLYVPEAPIGLVVDLVGAAEVERLPDAGSTRLLGASVPLVRLDPFPASAPAKLRLAVRVATGSIMLTR